MKAFDEKNIGNIEVNLPEGREPEVMESKAGLARPDIINTYRVAEFVTLAWDGSPVCWPLFPDYDAGRLIFSTGYVYPTKARNAQRNPRVAALFSDPTASGRSDDDPFVLVQGIAEVFDQDLQRNTERYVDQLLHKGPAMFRITLQIPVLRQFLVGYLTRIWIEMTPQKEYAWSRRTSRVPEPLRTARRPGAFSPGAGINLPNELFQWLPRYTRPPVLAFIDRTGWPAMTRVHVTVREDYIDVGSDIESSYGAPACLTFHRLVGNYVANDAFLIRGHFDTKGRLIPEKVVGYGGSSDDRGVGSVKVMRMMWAFRGELTRQMEKEGCPIPVVRPSPRA